MRILGHLTPFLLAFACTAAEWTQTTAKDVGSPGPGVVYWAGGARADRDVDLHLVRFDPKQCTLKVIDHPDPGSGDLGSAMREAGAWAGVNGGYFHPDRTPLGLLIRDGKTLHPYEKAKLLSGIVMVHGGKVSLVRSAAYKAAGNVQTALQAGPFLVEGGRAVPGLNSTRRAARTAVLLDAVGNGGLLVTGSVTLAELAELLVVPGVLGDLKVARALNLDGGSSSGLWVGTTPRPTYLREFKDVRNYLALVPISPGKRAK